MNPLRLIRTSTFQLAWWYMGIFGASALVLIGVVWWATVGYIEEQNAAFYKEDVDGLAAAYRRQGLPALAGVIQQRLASNLGLYLLVDSGGKPLAGNLRGWPEGPPDAAGWYNLVRTDEKSGQRFPVRGRVFNLQGGQRLLVAQDQSRLEAARQFINRASVWA